MKITFNKQQPEFAPVQMAVDIETLEDAKVWYAIFNHGRNNRLLGKNAYADKLEEVVGERGGQIIRRVGGDEGCLFSENLY